MNQSEAVQNYLSAKEQFEKAVELLELAFDGYKDLIAAGKYQEAREYLRPMPHSPEKVLAFRAIIVAEELDK